MVLKRRGLFEYVAQDLATRIFTGHLRPGDKLPTEHQLCEEFGVSRTVIRDALRFLSTNGLIEARPHSGTTVRGIGHWNFLDPTMISWARDMGDREGFFDMLMEARAALELQTVRIASLKATAADIARIEKYLIGMESAASADPPDFNAFNEADINYHLAILDATQNLILRQFGAVIKTALRATFDLSVETLTISEDSLAAHRIIFEAIRDGDPDTASAYIAKAAAILEINVQAARRFRAEG